MRGFVADRQEYRKPTRVARTPNFKETRAREEWPASPIRYVHSGFSFADHGEVEDELANIVPPTSEHIARLRSGLASVSWTGSIYATATPSIVASS